MSEKIQRKAADTRQKMITYYGEDKHHKHNKFHLRFQADTHKQLPADKLMNGSWEIIEGHENWSPKTMREFKLRKTRKRLDKGRFH